MARIFLVLTLLLVACAPQPEPARRGGTLVFAWQEPETLNPLYATGAQASALISAVAVEGLLRTGPDAEPVPVLAREVPTVENGGVRLEPGGAMTVRYSLRAGVRWSDDVPLTAADVAFTWRTIMSDPKVASREGYDLIDAVDTPDDLTVVVRYRGIYPAYGSRFDAVLPRHLLAGVDDIAKTDYGRKPLGTGPFRISEFVPGDHVTAERNPHYREPGKPLLDRLIFRFVPSLEAAKAQLKAGEVHVNASVGEADVPELRQAGLQVDVARSPVLEALAFNLERPITGDLAVRRALLLATPKAELVARLLGGAARVGESEIPIGWAASDVRQEAFDVDAARRVLEEAGWTAGPDGIRTKAGLRAAIRITSTTGNKLREQVEQVLVDRWRGVGIEATIRNVPTSVLAGSWSSGGLRKRGDFDVVLAQLGLGTTGTVDPQAYLAQRHRCDAIPRQENGGAGANYERLCDPRVDSLLDEAGRTLDRGRRRALYGELLRITNERAVAIWLYERARINAYAPGVRGYVANPWGQTTWNVQDWSLSQ